MLSNNKIDGPEIISFLKNTYSGNNILITGHTGFKGSWLSIVLNEFNANVIGYALKPESNRDNFVLTGLENKVNHIEADIRDYSKLQNVFDDFKPKYVFHFAANSLVKKGYKFAKETYDVNIGGTVNVLECCQLSDSVKSIIVTTTDKVYENKEWKWGYREIDKLGGNDPYSSSKAASELVVDAYRASFLSKQGKSVSSVRAGNVIGGGDWAAYRIVPDCIRAIENNRAIELRNPESIRPWQFVLEPLFGYLLLMARMNSNPEQFSGAWNFGPSHNSYRTVRELVQMVTQSYGAGRWENQQGSNSEYESKLLMLDCNKTYFELGWKTVLELEESIDMTIEWYKLYQTSDAYKLCTNHLNRYMQLISNSYTTPDS